MALSRRSKQGLAAFSAIQQGWKRIKYLMPQLSVHEKALRMNERFDKEARYGRNKENRSNA